MPISKESNIAVSGTDEPCRAQEVRKMVSHPGTKCAIYVTGDLQQTRSRETARHLSPTNQEAMLAEYRVYFMNGVNGHIERAQDLIVANDQEAVKAAKALLNTDPIELWSGTRKIQRFETPSASFLEAYRAHTARQDQQVQRKILDLTDPQITSR